MNDEESKKIYSILGMTSDNDITLSKASMRRRSGWKFEKFSRLIPCKLKESNSTTLKSPKEGTDA
jgi:hypothetical protein